MIVNELARGGHAFARTNRTWCSGVSRLTDDRVHWSMPKRSKKGAIAEVPLVRKRRVRKRKARAAGRESATLPRVARPMRPALSARTIREKGREQLWTGSIGAVDFANVWWDYLTPLAFGPRLNRLATCYERYMIHSVTFHVQLSGPMTSAARVVLFVDLDATDPFLPATAEGVSALMSNEYARQVTLSEGKDLRMSVVKFDPSPYYVSFSPAAEMRTSFAGAWSLWVPQSSAGVAATVSCEYDITFLNPETGFPDQSLYSWTEAVAAWETGNIFNTFNSLLPQFNVVEGARAWVDSLARNCLQLTGGAYTMTAGIQPRGANPAAPLGLDAALCETVTGVAATVSTWLTGVTGTVDNSSQSVFYVDVPLGSVANVRLTGVGVPTGATSRLHLTLARKRA